MPPKKDQYSSPSQKILNLFSILLFTGRQFSLGQIAEMLECSKQTASRITEELARTRDIQLRVWKEDRQKWFQIESSPRPHVSLSPREIQLLGMCKELVWHLLPKGISEEVESALNKTTALLPNMANRADALDSIYDVSVKGAIDYTPYQDIIETILHAIREKNVCEIIYQSPHRSEPKSHCFAPMKIISYHESLYAEGFSLNNETDQEILHQTTFSIHRINDATILNRKHHFETRENDQKQQAFGFMEGEPFPVLIKFTPQVAHYIKERIWSDHQTIKSYKDGSILLKFMVQSAPELIAWVLSFGKEAKLIKPKALKERVAEELKLTTLLYN
ncbi:helix-turn-helix transcriptional regulator [Solidesulfovibrio magneticus]|nr:WYL domain-containing protein [Solidesulfovibrio magneticus]